VNPGGNETILVKSAAAGGRAPSNAPESRAISLSIDQHRTDQVYLVVQKLAADGQTAFRPGHIADTLRKAGTPLLTWEIRGELARLEAAGLVVSDPETGAYSLGSAASRKTG
jgi:hypothetical protein